MDLVPLATAAALLALTLAGCGSEDGDAVAVDPGAPAASPSSSPPATTAAVRPPTEVPAAEGLVVTRTLATVMDTGSPELCLGAVAESYPPQCGGPPILGWDWQRHGQGMFEQQGKVRWGTFVVTGHWDGTSLEVTEAIPGPLYDAAVPEPQALPEPATTYDEAALARIAAQVGRLPGAQGAYSDGQHVLVDVTYDDGSLQEWADQAHGAGVVVVNGALAPVPAR